MSEKKIKVMTLGDMPLSTSGVAHQTRLAIEAMLNSGKFEVVSLGGAVRHRDYNPIKTDKYKDAWRLFPVDGFGTKDMVRSFLRNEKPDILWFMTDPRFYEWLWAFEDEILPLVPMVYYHVWDNYPYPTFNKGWYNSNDIIVTISKVTDDIVKNVAPNVERHYLPHTVDTNVFKKLPEKQIKELRKDNFPNWNNDKFVFFWNNRNARRKIPSSILWWYKEWLDDVGHEKACMVMHTDPYDENGPNLDAIMQELKLNEGQLYFSRDKVDQNHLSAMYNIADCVINVSDAEGFGLGTLESLSCETPIIVNMTGGLQEQVTDGENWFGVGIEPASKVIIGSQAVPWIYEDRVCKKDFINALNKIYSMSKTERKKMGKAGRAHVLKNYNYDKYGKKWVEIMLNAHEKYGSWESRKNYEHWTFQEVA